MMTLSLRSRSGLLVAAGLALFGLSSAGGQAWAEGEPLSGEQRMRREAIHKVQEAMGPDFVPPASMPGTKSTGANAQATRVRQITAAANTGFRCLPSCATDDGRFLAIAGINFQTLSPPELTLEISVPAGSTSFQIGIFDGDGGEYQDDGITAYWDSGLTALFEYSLVADPTADGTGTFPVDLAPGQPIIFSDTLPDNGWGDFTVATGPEAISPSGNYFYALRIRLVDASLTTLNAFKVRSTATLSGVTLNPVERPFSYIAPWTALEDISTIYPLFPLPTPTTYDGTFSFYMDVPTSQSEIPIWDGDFDHGDFLLTNQDTDDPNTPNAPFLPSWSTAEVEPEGVASGSLGSTGNPSDDDDPLGFGIYRVRSPAVRYDLRFPDGRVFANDNPSGNQEWEQFTVSTEPFDSSQMDYSTPTIPPGTYELRINGVDMLNLNALLLPFRVLCVDELGVVCQDIPRPFRVGDTVFEDRDADGNQDGDDPGIPGVVVELRDFAGLLIGTETTDADGHYFFDVEAGDYTVVVAASNFAPDGALVGYAATTPEDHTDTVIDDNVLVYDFGYQGTGSVGDRVWLDVNADGDQDSGEDGINGVTVRLLDGDGNEIASTTTSSDGDYTFEHLAPGTYTVRIDDTTLPAGLAPSFDLDGIGTADAATFQLAPGANRTDVDFGYKGTGSIGDRVWYDVDGDGAQDGGEAGLNGVTVRLLDGDGNTIATTVTAGNGNYTFDELPAGDFTVVVDTATLPAGAAPTYDLDGTGTAHQAAVTLAAGGDRTDADFGYRGNASLGDRVWLDLDGDGAQDATESGLNGVTVELLDGSGAVIATTTTSGNGNYSFGNLLGGTYQVRVVAATLPPGAVQTYDLDGTGTPHVATVTLAAGAVRTDVDFGYRGSSSLGDRVWYDVDGDGVQDAGETGLNGVTVELLNGGGTVIATTTAVGNGNYSFINLSAGTYTVRVVAATLPGGAVQTYDLDGTGTANAATVTLATGASRVDVDFGYKGTGSIGDRLWYDTDGDGVQDSGEPGLAGTTVELLNSSGAVIATRTADSNGVYSFNNLLAGSYTVRVVTSTFPAGGLAPTYDLDGTGTAHTATVTLASGQTRTDVDFGYRGTRSLGDRVWQDLDGDGAQDAGEPGINGVTVRLYLGSTQVASTVTAGDGNYSFTNLPETTFTVRIDTATLPAGVTQTYDLDGLATPHQATVNLTASRTDVDFGYRPASTCTAGYFKDLFDTASFSNNNGTLSWAGAWIESDTAGTGVSSGNVTVGSPYSGYLFLRDSPDTGTQPSAARQVNLAGFSSATLSFSFHVRTGVDPDDAVTVEVSNNGGASYTVLETLSGFTGTYTGSRSYNISAYMASNTRIRFRVSNNYGASDELFKLDWVRIDTSCTPAPQTGSIGNRVWNDADADGVQDSGEAGIDGVTVKLLNSSGTVIATTTTAGNGDYTFGNLAAGSYSVRIVSSTLPSGAVQTYDLDGTGTLHVAAVTLASGQNRTDADFGYRILTGCTAGNFKDLFSTASFSNNNGTLSWAGAWIESDVAGAGVSNGNVTVGSPYSGYLFLRDSPDTGTQPSAARQANLSGFASASLSFSFHVRTAVDADDAVVVEVSKNGGASYTVLETLSGFTGTYTGSRGYNISAFLSSNTRIRFRVSNNYGAGDELFKLDWVSIDGSCAPPENPPGTGTIGYWKTHPEAWPVAQIAVGGKTYTKSQAIIWMDEDSNGDKTIDLFKQLVAAKLNVLIRNVASCINSTISSADAWLVTYPLGSNVSGSSSAWQTGGPLHERLDDYNNGQLCAPHRD
jgi:hypothetical protein